MRYNDRKFLLVIIISVLLSSCGGGQEDSSVTKVKANVQICNPIEKKLTGYLILSGNTIFIKKEIVRATFQGHILKSFKTIGDIVNTGDQLFSIKTKEAYAVDSMVNIGDKFNGEITIKANSPGVLTQINYNTGDYISDGEQIAVISNPSSLKINLSVPYREVSLIKLNSRCSIELPDGKYIDGTISKKIPSVDPVTQTQTFLIDIPKGTSLPENLNLIVKIPMKEFKNTTTLPKSAIMSSDVLDEFWIMKLINDTTAVKINIEKGIEDNNLIQIISPKLHKEDRIVIVGAYGLPDTAIVKVGK